MRRAESQDRSQEHPPEREKEESRKEARDEKSIWKKVFFMGSKESRV